MHVERDAIQNFDVFSEQPLDGLNIPLLIEKRIEPEVKQHYKIDLIGWSSFKRLALVEK